MAESPETRDPAAAAVSRGGGANSSSNKSTTATATQQTWTTARCHRLIRPLTAKLHALKSLLQSPSLTTTANCSAKETKRDPAELPYNPSQAKHAPRRPPPARRSSTSDRDLFFSETGAGGSGSGSGSGGRPPNRRVRRTYSANPNPTRNTTPQVLVPTISNSSVYNLPFPAAAIDWDSQSSTAPADAGSAAGLAVARAAKPPAFKEVDLSHPQSVLQSLKQSTHPSLFSMYSGIYSALETILVATAWEPAPCEPVPPLKLLAARRIAHCILATEGEMDADDAWYDTAEEVGVGGEYLREIVRWHAVELVRDAVCSNAMPSQQKSGFGLPGALVGLCRYLGADAEAESLLKTMIELYPLTESAANPSLVALMNSWKTSTATTYRILADSLLMEGSPVPLGNPTVNKVLKSAVGDVEGCAAANSLVTRALECGFGIWGRGHATAALKERRERARRHRARGSGRCSGAAGGEAAVGPNKERKRRPAKPVPSRVGERAEEMALFLVEKLVIAAQTPRNTRTRATLEHLARGFFAQDQVMRTATEDQWEEWYPIAGKVAILLQGLGRAADEYVATAKELVRCLHDVREALGGDGLRSLGEFVAACYENLYTASGKSITGEDEVRVLVGQLLSYASTGSFLLQSTGTGAGAGSGTPARARARVQAHGPKTPLKPSFKMVTYTPGRKPDNPEQEKERYYITQLALNVAIGFSTLKCAKHNDKWNSWVGVVEHEIIGMKLRTPAKAVKEAAGGGGAEAGGGGKVRKGWRWEEGLDEWVAVGGTPGGALRAKAKPRFKNVEIPVDVGKKRAWRRDYEVFSDPVGSGGGGSRAGSSSPAPQQQPDSDSEDPDTSFSQLFENDDPESSTSDVGDDDGDDDDDDDDDDGGNDGDSEDGGDGGDDGEEEEEGEDGPEYYAPTPARPTPPSLRRSPRKTERIKRSLRAFAVVLPGLPPVFPARRKSGGPAFDFTGTGWTSPSPSPSQGQSGNEAEEEEEEEEEEGGGGGDRAVLRPATNGQRVTRSRGRERCSQSADHDESDEFPRRRRRQKPSSAHDPPYEEGAELSEDELSTMQVVRGRIPAPRRRSLLCMAATQTKKEKKKKKKKKKRKAAELQEQCSPPCRRSKRRAVLVSYQDLSDDELAL